MNLLNLTTLNFIILFTLINGLLAFAGAGLFIISRKINKSLIYLVSFTTGSLLGGAFFHFIPEAFEKLGPLKTGIITIAGFLIFLFLEKILYWHHCHNGKCEHVFNTLILYGDAVHNFIDGLIIASSFIISIPLGIVTSLLIMAHEIPQEIGDFGVLLYGGFSKRKALLYNFLAQLTSVLGGIVGYFMISAKEIAVYLLPIGAGGFLYIAIADLIPEIYKEKNPIRIIINILIIILGMAILISAKFFAG